MKVQKSIEINASPQHIWPFFIEPEKILQWCITFKKFQYTGDQRRGPGTPVYIEEQGSGPFMKINFTIVEYKENEKLALRMVSGKGLKSYDQSWALEPIQTGSQFTFKEEIKLPYGLIGMLVGSILEGQSAATVDKMLAKLKALAEA